MCGLFGWIGNLQPDKRLVLATLLAKFNTKRGEHSWGFTSRRGGPWQRERGLGEATRAIYKLAKNHTVMAHTRWATSGNITVENAHPFELNGVMLAHNGVIYNDYDFIGEEDYQVDSQLILNRIAEGRNLSDLAGYGTITFTRPDNLDTVYLCNVGQGDLAIACVLNRKKKVVALVWSSLEGHLADTLNTAHLNWQMYQASENVVYAAKATGLYRTSTELEWSEGDHHWRSWRRNGLGHLEAPPKSEPKPGVGRDDGMVRTKCSIWDPKLGVWHDVWYWTKPGDEDDADADAPDYDLFAEYQGEKEIQV